MMVAEVTIDGRRLTPEQVMTLRATVQATIILMESQNLMTLSDVAGPHLREINRLLCGELLS